MRETTDSRPPDMLAMTNDLACRLETAEAIDSAGCAEAHSRLYSGAGAAAQAIGGGVAAFCGVDSPLTHAVGVGMHGPVTDHDIDELEAFFENRNASTVLDLCPHSDPSLREILFRRRYRVLEFINVMVRPMCEETPVCDAQSPVTVRLAEPHDLELFTKTVIGGFFGREHLTELDADLGATLFHMPCSRFYLAFLDGQAVGAAGMSIRNRVANFFSDATALHFRGRGVQSALIRARLAVAEKAECDLLTAGTTPGSVSQCNYEKLGFRVAYTKATMGLE